MFFWKIDDETIRCLINKEEIGQMGFDLNELSSDNDLMEEFLNAIIASSKNYINWNTDNGVQNYIARALPSEQFLITISCTFQDVAIDRDLDQIKKMTTALRERISDDRIDSIYSMSGEEKEREFEALAKDLHDVCMGNTTEKEEQENETKRNKGARDDSGQGMYLSETALKTLLKVWHLHKEAEQGGAEQAVRPHIPSQKLIFKEFRNLIDFCSLLNKDYFIPSSLYKDSEEYILLVEFPIEMDNSKIITFMITAEEYGAECSNQRLEGYYLSEHAKLLIKDKAVETLYRMN
ncbi:MAG: adaptor protein MecA [Anaerobutyricum soehngenii]